METRNDSNSNEKSDTKGESPLVSVCVQTYQHAPYIKQCLDSILRQKTNFPFEIVLGEDESTDGTREICQAYTEKFPDKIRLFLRKEKDKIYIDGRKTGRFNFIENLKAVRGRYVALCEGDDYWIDPHKLQKQVDFLEANEEYVACFHNVKKKNELTKNFEILKGYSGNNFDINDVILKKIHIHICSFLFRNVISSFPEWFYKSISGDIALNIIIASFGKLHYINEPMSIYRVHKNGIFSDILLNNKYEKLVDLYINNIDTYYQANKHFNYSYKQAFKQTIQHRFKMVLKINKTLSTRKFFRFIVNRFLIMDFHILFHLKLIYFFVKEYLRNSK